jgi:hemerythrin-like domain-containing protein
MDIYTRLRKEHDEARDLLANLKNTTPDEAERRSELFERLKRDLWVHHKIEEAVFYSVLAEKRKTRGEAFEAINEHHMANGLLEELDSMPKGSGEWSAKLGVLKELVEHHMEEEEEEIFDEAKAVLSDDQAAEMGVAMADRKTAVMAALKPIHLEAS